MSKKHINKTCYISLESKAEIVSEDGVVRIPLIASEYKILSYFIDNAEKPVYLKDLAYYMWGENEYEKDTASLKSQISRIRQKLNKAQPGLGNCIETNYGFGSYTLRTHDIILTSNDDVFCNDIQKHVDFYKSQISEIENKMYKEIFPNG